MAKLSAADKTKIEKLLNDWCSESSIGQRVSRNIDSEHFLSEDKLEDLLLFIAAESPTAWEDFELKYQLKCYSLALQGGKIKITKRPQYFGVAVEYEIFLKHLKDNYPTYLPLEVSRKDFISRLSKGKLSTVLGELIRLKKFSVWGTWNKNNLAGMPFDYGKTNDANEIRANIGLNRDDAKKSTSLLLFIYAIPSHIEPLRPTIADAELSQYFEPPPQKFEEHGLTVTWQKEEDFKRYNMTPRPECIHDSILLSQLKLPVEIRP